MTGKQELILLTYSTYYVILSINQQEDLELRTKCPYVLKTDNKSNNLSVLLENASSVSVLDTKYIAPYTTQQWTTYGFVIYTVNTTV